jgi:hypothetical protein
MTGVTRGFHGERWLVLVTDGLTIAFPPEVYRLPHHAEEEGERWAWLLAQGRQDAIKRPFEGRWEIDDHWVRLLHLQGIDDDASELWIGTYWTRGGYPDPEAETFSNHDEAREWALQPASGRVLTEVSETPWSTAVTFRVRDYEEYAVVHRAKVMA